MNCTVCYRILGKDISSVKLNCSCSSCVDCLSHWMIEQINTFEFQTKEEILCMEGYCKQPFKVEEVICQFPLSYQEKINDALLSVYFRKTQDIRQCPREACNYAGIFDMVSTCGDEFQCAKCKSQWREKITAKDSDIKRILLPDASELSCAAWEELFTKKCPKCNTSIEKNGGCSHMTCKGCGKEFCWYCTQDNFTHDNKICWINLSAKLLFVVCFLVHLICLSGICEEIVEVSLKVFNGVLEAFFLDFFLYLLCIISPHDIIGRFYTPENKIRLLTSLAIFSFFLLVVFLLEAFYSILRIFIFQAVVVGVGLIYVDCFGKWVTYVY